MADHAAVQMTSSFGSWSAFLQTAARLYKYPYLDQLMIYAQRPDATACAAYDLWNDRMGRYVKRGAKGIALLDDSRDRPVLRYVFDVSDTGTRRKSRAPWLWTLEEPHLPAVAAALEQSYEIPGNGGLVEQLEIIAATLSAQYWNDHREDVLDIVDGSLLAAYDHDTIGVQFRTAATISVAYTLLSRCGLAPEEVLHHEDFMPIFDFNTPATIGALGTAVSQLSEQVLRQIERTIKHYEREQIAERSDHHDPDLHTERGLPDSRPAAERAAVEAPGQVRADAESVPQDPSPDSLQPAADAGEAVPAPHRDRGDGTAAPGADDAPAGGGSGRDGAVESPRSDAVGGLDEQLQSPGGGDPAGRADPQLNLFSTEEESSVQAPGSFSLSRQDAEQELLRGSLIQNGSLRIYALYQHNPTVKEAVDFLKEEYGVGGHSYTFGDGGNGFVDYDSKGIHFRRYADQATALLPWKEADKLLRHLIHSERYLSEEDAQKYAQLEEDFSGWPGGIPKPYPGAAFPDPVLDLDSSLIREALAQRGIVDGQVADQEKLDQDPFVQQVMADAERIAAEEEVLEDTLEEVPPRNFRITDDHLGEGGSKAKFRANLEAIETLKAIEAEGRSATPEEQEILSRYVGWGGLADAFDPGKENWNKEYSQLKALLTPEEYTAARSSTLNAHYTSPTVIRAIYEAISRLGFQAGNILEPACGVGNFFGMLPEEMRNSRLYGVELDSISGRIAKQLYPEADITVAGFETTNRRDFYDLAIGNVPFGQYQVNDKAYNKLGFSIHNYFFAKALDQVRPGGLVAFVTSRYTMDAKAPTVRRYLAQRAELLGAIRLPNNAFQANAGTDVVSDILFLQRREQPVVTDEPWVHLGFQNGIPINSYFVEHPEMVLGELTRESTQYGREEATVRPLEGVSLTDQLREAVQHIQGNYQEASLPDLEDGEAIDTSIPADPSVKNYSYTVVEGEVYYRENSRMVRPQLSATAKARVKAMVELRDCVHHLIDLQLQDGTDGDIQAAQQQLNALYDAFTPNFGLVNDKVNRLAFSDDASYYLLCALEVLDQDGKLERKADLFTKRTIRPQRQVTSVDTPSEALAVSLGERGRVDLSFMAELLGTPGEYTRITRELSGIIFCDPLEARADDITAGWHTADDYLSGNVREKLRQAKQAAQQNPAYTVNVEALTAAQPRDLDASEIEARLGATWIESDDIQKFMVETFDTPYYMRRAIQVQYSAVSAEWRITGKSMPSQNDVAAYMTYGTDRANAYRILEETLNLKDIRIYDTVEDADGKQRRVLNKKATTLAQQKQQAIKDAFQDWLWKDPRRRERLVAKYNEQFNSTRPREYDGSHIVFGGMNPEIQLREHQKNAIAHILYGGNTLLAHEVGGGKTFEMVAAAMESKRLGLCQKSMFVVPNHLTEQWASEFLRLYPSANLLVTTKKDFEAANRKKFCARIATGDYDAIIIGHSQFERIPISKERQARLLEEQIDEIEAGLSELQHSRGESFTIKQMEKIRKSLQAKLEKLMAEERKDDVIDFEQLGVDRLFVDESQNYKNLFLYTKMRNVAGLSTAESQRSSDIFAKCRYMDELTGNRGVIFASGTPVSNSMTELYSVMRYLQYSTLRRLGMTHFDCWASTFGETTTAIELAPEGTGYRARTRFSKFFNLPELMNIFKEVADIKTADQLHLPVPEAKFETVVVKPSQLQQEMVQRLSDRAAAVHSGKVDASEDNMLLITSDGRKIGLDQRLMNPLLPDDPNSKVNACVQNVLRIWEEGQADKLTQLLFCDISTPKNDGSFNIYDDIKGKLLAAGVPEAEIAFIHQADTEVKKKDLFAKVRSGQVRILLGSTQKMGAGTNCQDRLVALHHLDVGWRPSDMTQRNGRIIRQGNQNKEVQIYQYVTEATFDAYLYQTLEQKQRFISQIMTSKSPVRSCDDVDEQALSYAEIKALCAGNPEIREKMDLDVEVARLKVLKADHQSQQYRLEDRLLKYFPAELELQRGFIRGFEQDVATAGQHPLPKEGFVGISIRGQTFTDKEDAGNALLAICRTLRDKEPVEVGTYRGFTVEVVYNPVKMEVQAILKGTMTHRAALGEDTKGNLLRLDHALAAIPKRLEDAKAHLTELEAQRDAAQAELGKPFPQEQQLREKSARLAELNALLDLEGHEETAVVETPVAKEKPSVLQRLSALEPPVRPEHKEHHKKEAERA